MGKQKVVIIHCSAIIQKGLADLLLHICNVSVSDFIVDYSLVNQISSLKNAILFLDAELMYASENMLAKLKQKGNSVYLITVSLDASFQPISYDGVLCINDNLSAIQKKLNTIFPALPIKKVEPTELSTREKEVLKLVAMGNSNKETADYLSISLHTVISHRKNICRKLEIKTISGLTLYALINNLIS